MKILILSDSIPGHHNQAVGLAGLIDRLIEPSDYDVIRIKLVHKWLRPLLRWVLNKNGHWIEILILKAYSIEPSNVHKAYDLIISAGGNTSYYNAFLAQKLQLNNIFIGSLRQLSNRLFKVCMTIEPIHCSNNLVMPFAPSLISYQSTQLAAKTYLDEHPLKFTKCWLMIVGGDGGGCHYCDEDWLNLIKGMKVLSEKHQVKWLITTSRRTGLDAEQFLIKNIPSNIVEQAVWFNHNPKKIMQIYLGIAQKSFCTIDSMSMLTESISSCTPTIALSPTNYHPVERFKNAVERFSREGYLQAGTISKLDKYIDLNTSKNIKDEIEVAFLHLINKLKKMLFDH